MSKIIDYGGFCKSKNCPEFIEWQAMGNCESCKLVGQSYSVNEYPPNCLHIDEIKDYKKSDKQ